LILLDQVSFCYSVYVERSSQLKEARSE
jgi:hypothetical protein